MVSNFPRFFVAQDEIPARDEQSPGAEWFGERVLDRVREAFCGLHGHDSMLQFQQDRLFLKCASCGYESPGWDLDQTPPVVTHQVDNQRKALARPQLIGERRVA